MSFLDKVRGALQKLLQGRYGGDQLSLALLWLSVLVNLLAAVSASVKWISLIFSALGFALLIFCLLRCFSRNTAKRFEENRKYLAATYPLRKKISEAKVRYQNRKIYLYFNCPNCKCKMRLPRSVHGTVKITCKSCGQVFERKL